MNVLLLTVKQSISHLISNSVSFNSDWENIYFKSLLFEVILCSLRLSWWLDSKESAWNAGDPGLIPGVGRSPGKGNDNPLQYSCLENPMDRGTWWTVFHGQSWIWLNKFRFQFCSLSGEKLWEHAWFWRHHCGINLMLDSTFLSRTNES